MEGGEAEMGGGSMTVSAMKEVEVKGSLVREKKECDNGWPWSELRQTGGRSSTERQRQSSRIIL